MSNQSDTGVPLGMHLPKNEARVVAVVVTYNPDPQALARQFAALLPQVHSAVVVDNGSSDQDSLRDWVATQEGACWLPLPVNDGLASAQNQGMRLALSAGASHVLLMDQDSEPHPAMVAVLLSTLRTLPLDSVVGPAYVDRRRQQSRSPFFRLHGLSFQRLPVDDPSVVHVVDHLIASGCLIPTPVLKRVGEMRSDFFIDFVDIEWSLRASHLGVGLYGVCAARMTHDLGDAPVVVLGRAFPVHSPRRHYFHVRNGVVLYRQPWITWSWRLASAWRLVLKVGFHVVFVSPRRAHWVCAWRGLRDGLRGHMGPCP